MLPALIYLLSMFFLHVHSSHTYCHQIKTFLLKRLHCMTFLLGHLSKAILTQLHFWKVTINAGSRVQRAHLHVETLPCISPTTSYCMQMTPQILWYRKYSAASSANQETVQTILRLFEVYRSWLSIFKQHTKHPLYISFKMFTALFNHYKIK